MAREALQRRESRELTPQYRGWDPFQMMQDLMRWDPFAEMMPRLPTMNRELIFNPNFEVKETHDGYVFKADLPGVHDKDVDINLKGNRLTISGKREEEERREGETYFAYERSYGTFSRTFTLPEGVDPERVNAELKEGVLTVTIPKTEEQKAKRIQVKSVEEKAEKPEVRH